MRRPPRIEPLTRAAPRTPPDPSPEPKDPAVAQPEAKEPAVAKPEPAEAPTAVLPPQRPATTTDDLAVPEFVVPGFGQAPAEPRLPTVLTTVLGTELWQRCRTEWTTAHCASLARVARAVDGLAPSAGTTLRTSAGTTLRWLGVTREQDELARSVAETIAHPAGATEPNRARTVRLYGAAICLELGIGLRRCACHRDLERDVSDELIRLGLEELGREAP